MSGKSGSFVCMKRQVVGLRVGSKAEGWEKRERNNQGKEGNEVTDCFSRLYFKMSPDWFSSQKGFRSSGFPVMMVK